MATRKILLTSVLKPVKDTRMYEKIGMALTKIDKAEIHIAGFDSKNGNPVKNIEFHPLFNFDRLNWKRLFSGWKIWQIQLKVKPEVIICNTHELLIVTVLYKILFGSKIIYDVQENYYRNLWYGDQFPILIKHVLALYIRVKEWIFSPFFDAFLLAEECYIHEMPVFHRKGVVIENKFKKPEIFTIHRSPEKIPLKLLYTGTIALDYGILECIQLAKELLQLQDGTFTIAGACPNERILEKVRNEIEGDQRIRLIGGSRPLSHSIILDQISGSNLAIMAYKNTPALTGRIPTKVYEYMSYKLPFIAPENASWGELASQYGAWIPVNFKKPDTGTILQTYLSTDFYPALSNSNSELSFVSEEKKLLDLLERILQSKLA